MPFQICLLHIVYPIHTVNNIRLVLSIFFIQISPYKKDFLFYVPKARQMNLRDMRNYVIKKNTDSRYTLHRAEKAWGT